jgi:hypothetical protein
VSWLHQVASLPPRRASAAEPASAASARSTRTHEAPLREPARIGAGRGSRRAGSVLACATHSDPCLLLRLSNALKRMDVVSAHAMISALALQRTGHVTTQPADAHKSERKRHNALR